MISTNFLTLDNLWPFSITVAKVPSYMIMNGLGGRKWLCLIHWRDSTEHMPFILVSWFPWRKQGLIYIQQRLCTTPAWTFLKQRLRSMHPSCSPPLGEEVSEGYPPGHPSTTLHMLCFWTACLQSEQNQVSKGTDTGQACLRVSDFNSTGRQELPALQLEVGPGWLSAAGGTPRKCHPARPGPLWGRRLFHLGAKVIPFCLSLFFRNVLTRYM